MNILYCGDSNIENGLMLSIMSITDHVDTEIHFYVLTMTFETEEKEFTPVSDRSINLIRNYIKEINPGNTVKKIDITELFNEEIPGANVHTRFTPFCMLRLFADRVPELPDTVLYLDNDVICRKSINELYYQDMSQYEISGVLDYYGKWFFRKNIFKADYINSGVLMMNLDIIRQTNLFGKCRKMCIEKKMFMPDQSALNKLSNYKKILPQKYNEQRKLRDNTVIQHFTTSFRFFPRIRMISVKPWQIDKMHQVLKLHEYDDLLSRYVKLKEKLENE